MINLLLTSSLYPLLLSHNYHYTHLLTMSVVLHQIPIALRNPFSVLEPEQEPSPSITNSDSFILTRAFSDDDLDRISVSSWSVINSAYASEDEDDDDVEIYMDASDHNLAPMTVSALSDGFTNISNVMTATSINSASAQPDTWVIKVSKNRSSSPKHKAPVAAAPTLEDVIERSESDDQCEDGSDEEMAHGTLPMSMSEHELSKSSKAVKLKNVRLAFAHDTALCKALNVTMRGKSGPRLPKNKSKYEKYKGRTAPEQN